MSKWDIQTDSVFAILQTVGDQVAGEDGSGGLVGKITEAGEEIDYAKSCASSSPISTALDEFVGHFSVTLDEMVATGASCVSGCGEAVNAYIQGDLEMAAEAQDNAGRAYSPNQVAPPDGGGNWIMAQ